MSRKTLVNAPRQLALVLGTPVLTGLTEAERAEVVDLLAQILLEASGVADQEESDENL